jgi:hypothetical protein
VTTTDAGANCAFSDRGRRGRPMPPVRAALDRTKPIDFAALG